MFWNCTSDAVLSMEQDLNFFSSGFVSEIVHIQEMCSVGSKLWPFIVIDV